MSSVTAGAPSRPGKAPFGATFWAVVRGYLWMLVVLAAVSMLFGLSGVADRRAILAPSTILFLRADWTSRIADLTATALLVCVAAWFVARAVRNVVDAPVSTALAGVAVAAGSLPLVLGFSPGFSALLLVFGTTWGVRDFAIGSSYRIPLSRPVRLAAIGSGLLVIAAYLFTHPLNVGGLGSSAPSPEGERAYGLLELRNTSFADLTILSVSGARVEAGHGPVRIQGEPAPRPVEGVVVPARDGQWLTLRDCRSATLSIRYRLLGRSWTEAVITEGTDVCPDSG